MDLFSPLTVGTMNLTNRLVMAPLTRVRSGDDGVPSELVATYYAQRASIGLITTEGVWPYERGRSYPGQPGIETPEQIEGWRAVADAVHAKGGHIVMQLMHGGRISHSKINGGQPPEAPSAVPVDSYIHDWDGSRLPVEKPVEISDLEAVKAGFVRAARNAVEAGLDGIELHSANGYLLQEFLAPSTNTRGDQYGGSPENRARFVIEVAEAVANEIGAEKVGIRLSPGHNIQGVIEDDASDIRATYGYLLKELSRINIAFVSVLRTIDDPANLELVQWMRSQFSGTFFLNNGFGPTPTTKEEAIDMAEKDLADAIEIGRAAIANPDVVRRWQNGLEENAPDPSTFYGSGAAGYTDYPFHE